ncbi:ferredoxin [Candidatus Falkowbacteria bacterium]|nr:ferredoxin [Candidatus Falkowbacteria bacterium]
MAIMVNQDLCIGCGTCEALCPSVFKLNQAGKAEVIRQDGAACAKNSAESCPVQAISIE